MKQSADSVKILYCKLLESSQDNLVMQLTKQLPAKLNYRNFLDTHNALLFILNHPANDEVRNWSLMKLQELTEWCQRNKSKLMNNLYNSGLPFTSVYSYFSWTLFDWLVKNHFICDIHDYDKKSNSFNEFLRLTLLPHQRSITEHEFSNQELLDSFGIKDDKIKHFIVYHFSQLNSNSKLANQCFEKQNFIIELMLEPALRSITWNKIEKVVPYYHSDWLKKLDTKLWISKNITLVNPSELLKEELERIIKTSLLVLQRETEPVTYMDSDSIRLVSLERGIQIVLFTMNLDHQLAYESYVGYTLFKNGYPAAYGGAWIIGKHALIGLNIFDWCRGGESNLFFTNLLQTYHQVFKISTFEVEPYQYGKDNPEGIESGAFWFYYRMGFRPVDSKLSKIAKSEFEKIKENKSYRTSKTTLKKFTESNISLELSNQKNISIEQILNKINNYTKKENAKSSNKNILIEEIALKNILQCLKPKNDLTSTERKFYTEYGMLALAMEIDLNKNPAEFLKLIELRKKDVYEYQEQWRLIFEQKL